MCARRSSKYLPPLALALGLTGLGLRQSLYAAAVDSRGLLVTGHPLETALWLLSAAALVMLTAAARGLYGEQSYEKNFRPSLAAGVGQLLAGMGFLATALLARPQIGNLGGIMKLLGLLSGPGLIAAGVCRFRGKTPFFLLYLVPCLFLVFYIIDHYRIWSSNPQLQDYVFSLFACLGLMLFAFYNGAFCVGLGRRRMQIATGLGTIFLSAVSLSADSSMFLHLAAIVWGLTGLCSLDDQKGA